MSISRRTDSKGRVLKAGELQRKDGSYRYRYSDSNGLIHDVYSSRLVHSDPITPDCRDKLSLREKEQIINDKLVSASKTRSNNRVTVNDMFDLYMSVKHGLTENTRHSYLLEYNTHIRNTFGSSLVTAVKYSDVKKLYESLLHDANLKLSTVKKINGLLSPVFNLAIRDGYIRTNPTDGIIRELKKSSNSHPTKRHALTIEEQRAFLHYVQSSRTYHHWINLFIVLLGTGMRVGEATGLTWQNCDFKRKMITVDHALVYRKVKKNGVGCYIDTPKTFAGIREIPMLDEVENALLAELKVQKNSCLKQPVIDGYTGFVFQNRFGDPQNADCINKALMRIITQYNAEETAAATAKNRTPLLLPRFSVHILRHTFCARYCENETNIKVIQEIMGHADIETTMNIYAEVTGQQTKESFKNLQGKITIR